MAIIHKHWKMAILNGMVIAIALIALIYRLNRTAPTAAALTQPATQGAVIAVSNRGQFDRVRRYYHLDSSDLAALGCTGAQASAIWQTTNSWLQAQAVSLAQTDNALTSALEEYNTTLRLNNIGPRSAELDARMVSARQGLVAAETARQALFAGLKSALEPLFTGYQVGAWKAAIRNHDLPPRYRYLPQLSAQQHQRLIQLIAKFGENAPEVRQRDQQILSTGQRDAAAQVEARLQSNLAPLVTVETAVLPASAPRSEESP